MDANVLLENLSAKLGTYNLDEKEPQEIIDILIASDEFMLSEFISSIELYLIEKRSDWLRSNIESVILICSRHSTMTKLWDYCLEEFCDDPQLIFNSPNLNDCLMTSFIQRNDINMDEIEIWDNLIRWGKAQLAPKLNFDVSRDVTKYSVDDFTALGKVIIKFLPYIRFDHICPNDFKEKVVPYKSLISIDIYEEILWNYISDSNFKLSPSSQRRFGEFGNQDFYMSDQFDSKTGVRCKKTYYSKRIRDSEESFAVDEYELFRL
ncbi:23660_t:CDS:2, partial [Gigaspora rosea]